MQNSDQKTRKNQAGRKAQKSAQKILSADANDARHSVFAEESTADRKDVITHISVLRLLRIIVGAWTLSVEPAKTGAEFAKRLDASETASRRIKYMLENDMGMSIGYRRDHAGHRGANGIYVADDFGYLLPSFVSAIGQAHRNGEPYELSEPLLKIGFSTDAFANFLWILASTSPYEVTIDRLCEALKLSKPTIARYLRIARSVFLMKIDVIRFALERGGECYYDVKSWGVIQWERVGELLGRPEEEVYQAMRYNKTRDRIKKMDSSPW